MHICIQKYEFLHTHTHRHSAQAGWFLPLAAPQLSLPPPSPSLPLVLCCGAALPLLLCCALLGRAQHKRESKLAVLCCGAVLRLLLCCALLGLAKSKEREQAGSAALCCCAAAAAVLVYLRKPVYMRGTGLHVYIRIYIYIYIYVNNAKCATKQNPKQTTHTSYQLQLLICFRLRNDAKCASKRIWWGGAHDSIFPAISPPLIIKNSFGQPAHHRLMGNPQHNATAFPSKQPTQATSWHCSYVSVQW